MSIRYLDSRDIETLSDALSRAAGRSREMGIAAAFLTMAGADQVLALRRRLLRPEKRQQVRVLVGTWLGVTEPAALRRLRSDKGILLRIAKTPGFHVKHVSFRGGKKLIALTGSANFTSKGLGGQGELVVEVSDSLRSSTDSVERDAFRRLWDDAYPDALTDSVIAYYSKVRRPPRFLRENGTRAGKSLLQKFGKLAARVPPPRDDGSVLWFPADESMADSTLKALDDEPGGKGKDYFLGLQSKSTFNRIQKGTRQVWLLDLLGRPKNRTLQFRRVIREVEMPTEDDGRYFAILGPVVRRILLTKANRSALKKMGVVKRVDSLASEVQTLRPGVKSRVAKLFALSAPHRPRRA